MLNYKCIRCDYLCDCSKRMEEHIDRKNQCKDINNCMINDINLLRKMIIDNTNHKIKLKEEEIKRQKELINANKEKKISTINDLKKIPNDNEKGFIVKEIDNNINKKTKKNIFSIEDIISDNDSIIPNLNNLIDSQEHQMVLSQHYKLDIIFNYNINLNIKQVTPFKDNPKMKESVEKLVNVVKEENNNISKELIKKEYELIMEKMNENNTDSGKFEIQYEKEINMNVSYNIVYFYDSVDNKGFFYINDINYYRV